MQVMNKPVRIAQPTSCSSKCPHADFCPLYDEFAHGRLLGIWKDRYCNSKYETCARFQLSRLGETIPSTLLPNGKSLR
ncbi:MAG: hypothetical protein U0745_10260 [Polyangia bacterium]|jgi:hypothetical protein